MKASGRKRALYRPKHQNAQHVNLCTPLDLLLLPMSFIYIAVMESNHFSGCQQASQFTWEVSAGCLQVLSEITDS